MVTTRRQDVVVAAGKLFAERGYHGTSMRDLGRELGLLGSSLYAHIQSKQDLLVAVVEDGAGLFEASAVEALASSDGAVDRLRSLIGGHVDVVLDNVDVSRTFLNEARVLDSEHRQRVVDARDHYEQVFRDVLIAGKASGVFRQDIDPKVEAIFILSILNALERWYHPEGRMDRAALVERIFGFVVNGLT